MTLKDLIEILDEHVELIIYDSDGLNTMHLYDKDYYYNWYKEFVEKKVICIKPHKESKARLEVYLEDYFIHTI